MPKPFIDFGAVKAAVSFQQVLDRYGLTGQMRSIRNGDGLEGPCPIHEGTSQDIFKVTLSKNCWFCHNSACKCGGNHLDFVAKMENVDAHEAALRLDQWFNLGLAGKSERPPQRRDATPDSAPPSREQGGSPASESRLAAPPAEEPPEEAGENKPLKFKLEKLKTDHTYLTERGLTPETVAEFGLGYCAKGTMSGRIVIPIHNVNGELVGYAGRWPGEPPAERPKYKLPKDFRKSAEVFNLQRAMEAVTEDQPLIVVEGFFDVMKLWQFGIKRAVSIMGSSLSRAQEQLLLNAAQNGTRIVLMFDEDESGRKGREQALLRLAKRAYVRVIEFPEPDMQPEHLKAEEAATLLSA